MKHVLLQSVEWTMAIVIARTDASHPKLEMEYVIRAVVTKHVMTTTEIVSARQGVIKNKLVMASVTQRA